MTFTIKFDDKKFTRFMDKTLKRQIPFAMSKTLNDMAFDSRAKAQSNIQNQFEITRPFIPKSIVVQRSTKRNLVAETGLLDRAGFFGIHEEGGTRKPRGRFIAVRRAARPGRAGSPSRVLQRARVFQTSQGIFQRLRRSVKQLHQYVGSAGYKPRPWLEPAAERAGRRFNDLFMRNLNRALRNSK